MENPPFWWYLPGKKGIFMGYVSLPEGKRLVKPENVFDLRAPAVSLFVYSPFQPIAFQPSPTCLPCIKKEWFLSYRHTGSRSGNKYIDFIFVPKAQQINVFFRETVCPPSQKKALPHDVHSINICFCLVLAKHTLGAWKGLKCHSILQVGHYKTLI